MKVDKNAFFTYMSAQEGNKNVFDLSHSNSGSCNMGYLIPVLLEPTLPDDYFKVNMSYLLRFAQMVAPPTTPIKASFFAFDCPNRILMDNKTWDKFLADVDGTSNAQLPTMRLSNILNAMYNATSSELYKHDFNSVADAYNLWLDDNFPTRADRLKVYNASSSQTNGPLFGTSFVLDEISSLSYIFNGEEDLILDAKVNDRNLSDIYRSLNTPNDNFLDIYPSDLFALWVRATYVIYPFKSTLLDYLGLPVRSSVFSSDMFINVTPFAPSVSQFTLSLSKVDATFVNIQVLPMIAYLYIWNEYFRQEFIQEEISEELLDNFNEFKNGNSFDFSLMYTLKRRCWEHDYYTSCLPSPQLGESSAITIGADGQFTIPELREANAVQHIREKLLHGGTRNFEILANFFNSQVNDARLQIPQFIGGASRYLSISDIYQTAPGSSDSMPILDASAQIASPKGTSVNVSDNCLSFTHKAKEHGYIMVLMNIQPEAVYGQGIRRHWTNLDTLDYGWYDFANLTEQPVKSFEVFADKDSVINVNKTFGYQSQYANYKTHESEIHGELRDELDFFHFGRIFDKAPNLNSDFLECNPTDRPFPISYEYDKITYHLYFDIKVERNLPYFGIPTLR